MRGKIRITQLEQRSGSSALNRAPPERIATAPWECNCRCTPLAYLVDGIESMKGVRKARRDKKKREIRGRGAGRLFCRTEAGLDVDDQNLLPIGYWRLWVDGFRRSSGWASPVPAGVVFDACRAWNFCTFLRGGVGKLFDNSNLLQDKRINTTKISSHPAENSCWHLAAWVWSSKTANILLICWEVIYIAIQWFRGIFEQAVGISEKHFATGFTELWWALQRQLGYVGFVDDGWGEITDFEVLNSCLSCVVHLPVKTDSLINFLFTLLMLRLASSKKQSCYHSNDVG